MDRVVAGCCWEVIATRHVPEESTEQIRNVTKHLTVLLAGYLAQEVASLFRDILGDASLTLYDETTAHLLCSNYWFKPIYQELVHASSRAKATRMGEPCSGLVIVSANPKPTKAKRPTWHTKRVSGWIGGLCPVDTLHLWFPAHCARPVIPRLHEKEQAHRAAHPAWFDLPGVREELLQKHKDAKEAREMSFTPSWGRQQRGSTWARRATCLGYGKRKSSNSRRGDNKVLHPSSFLKWKCWGRSSIHPCRVSAIARGGGKTASYQE